MSGKVILLYPRTGFDIKKVSVDIPLSLLAASSFIAEDYEVKIIDQRVDDGWEQKLKAEIEKGPICLGITAMTCPQIRFGLEVCRIAKDISKDIKTVWGGVHATLMPEETLAHPYVDIVVRGEGEIVFKNLVDVLKKNRNAILNNIRGISFKDRAGKIVHTTDELPVPMDNLKELPYHILDDIEVYIGSQGRFNDNNSRSLIYISSRGCPYRCTFCAMPGIRETQWRSEPVETTYERIMTLKERFKLDSIAFHDENFLSNPKRAERIAEMIGGELKWWIQARMDNLLKVNVGKLVKNGLASLQPGIESGSDRILKLIKKGETVDDYIEANRMLARTDIEPLYNFMVGFPTETVDEIYMTLDLSLRLLEENPKAMVAGFYVVVPYPGTELYTMALEYGFKPPATLEGWADYNRQHLATPWVQDRLDLINSIKLSSRFVDGIRLPKRIRHAFGAIPVPILPLTMLGRYYKRRWQKRKFDHHLDTTVNSFVMSLFNLSQKFESVSRKISSGRERLGENTV